MPDVSELALFRHALGAFRRHEYVTASDVCRQILARRRNDPNAIMLLAEIARATDRREEEHDCLLRAVRLSPRNPLVRERLGDYHAFWGEYPRALAQYEKARKLDPALLGPVAGMAEVYELQNKADKARRLLEPHARGAPREARVHAVHVRLLVNAGEIDAAVEEAERVLAANLDESIPLRDLCFQLARAYEKRGDYDRAMDAAHRGNAMLAPPYDPDALTRATDAMIAAFPAERLAAAPRPREPSELPVFIVGMPRCGSTLIERILDAHPAVHGAGEIRAMNTLVRELSVRIGSTQPYPECVEDLDDDDVDALSRGYLAELRALDRRAERVCNKDLGNHRHVGLLSILFPRGRVIHCRRDALDTCLSCYLQSFAPTTSPFTNDLVHVGRYYRDYERLMAHWRAVVDTPLLEVDYEALVDDQEGVSRRIVAFCGLPWDDACLRFHETARADRTLSYDQVRRPIYRSAMGRAERFGARLDPLRAALAGPGGR